MTKSNKMRYMVLQFLNKVSITSSEASRNSELCPKATEAMCKEARHPKTPGGMDGKVLTIGGSDRYDAQEPVLVAYV